MKFEKTMNAVGVFRLAAILADEEDEYDERMIRIVNLRRRRLIRSVALPFRTLSEQQFAKKFRFPKELAHWLCEVISPRLPNDGRCSHISKDIQILSTLRFYGTGSFQESIGDFSCTCCSQSTMSHIIHKVTLAILTLQNDWVKFPVDPQELQRISEAFEEHIGFPGVIGAIDCTHVSMRGPHVEKWNYLNYNRYYSINVQVTCDDKLRITSSDTYPGTTHDATIWRNSQVKQRIDRFNEEGQVHYYLIGDSGYPLQPSLLTPIANAEANSPEEAYNERFTHTRSIVERVFGTLKGKFKCVQKHRTLFYQPGKAVMFFKACAILHNILINYRGHDEDDGGDEDDGNDVEMNGDENSGISDNQEDQVGNGVNDRLEARRGQQMRVNIVQQYFAPN